MTDRTDPPPGDPRLRGLFQALPRRCAPGEECPEPAELWASARGEVGPERQRWLIGHTGRCPSCAEDWRLARHLERTGAVTGSTGAAGGHSGSSAERLRRFALAATVILAVAVAALWAASAGLDRGADPGETTLRGAGPQIESLTSQKLPLSRTDPVLRWSGPEGARYDLVVSDERGRPVYRAEGLTGTAHPLPPEVVDGLPSGSVLSWQVIALLPDGSDRTSRTFRVTLE